MSNALKYTGLVGKYIRMSRPATEAELKVPLQPDTVGMECLVAGVKDHPLCVEIISDYGMSFAITPEDEDQWTFEIWDNEEALEFRH